MTRLQITLPPLGELRLEQRTPPRELDGLRLNPPIHVPSLDWDWYAILATKEVVKAAQVPYDFRLSLPGGRTEGSKDDYVCMTMEEVFVLPEAAFEAGAVNLLSRLARYRAGRQ